MEDFLTCTRQIGDDVTQMEICTIDLNREELLETGILQIGIYNVCVKGKVQTLEWLLKKYMFSFDELRATIKAVICDACVRNDLEIAQILLKQFENHRQDILTDAGIHWIKIIGKNNKKKWDLFVRKL